MMENTVAQCFVFPWPYLKYKLMLNLVHLCLESKSSRHCDPQQANERAKTADGTIPCFAHDAVDRRLQTSADICCGRLVMCSIGGYLYSDPFTRFQFLLFFYSEGSSAWLSTSTPPWDRRAWEYQTVSSKWKAPVVMLALSGPVFVPLTHCHQAHRVSPHPLHHSKLLSGGVLAVSRVWVCLCLSCHQLPK